MKKYFTGIISILLYTNMVAQTVQGVILAAGKSTRFNTTYSKLTVPICGRPMILYPILTLSELKIPTTVVVGYKKEIIKNIITYEKISNITFAVQAQQKGAGHALLCSKDYWFADHILVLNGDNPLITKEAINRLIEKHSKTDAAFSFLTTINTDPNGAYGRVFKEGSITKIIEPKHFTGNFKEHPLINAGTYIAKRAFLEQYLGTIRPNQKTHEIYLTDLPEIATANGLIVSTTRITTHQGLNNLKQLAQAEKIIKTQIIEHWMSRGVRFLMPETILVDHDVTIEKDAIVQTGVQLRNGTRIGKNCTIGAFSIITNSFIADNSLVKPHSVIENDCKS